MSAPDPPAPRTSPANSGGTSGAISNTRVGSGAAARPADRLAPIFAENFQLIWRVLRRFGVPLEQVDDAVQEVFTIAAARAADIVEGRERSFLFGTARRVASTQRRRLRHGEQDADLAVDPVPGADDLLAEKRARETLDRVLDAMDDSLREVLVLCEIEELTAPEVASMLEIPVGTVTSRLRRAREQFNGVVRRFEAKRPGVRGGP